MTRTSVIVSSSDQQVVQSTASTKVTATKIVNTNSRNFLKRMRFVLENEILTKVHEVVSNFREKLFVL